MTLADDGAMGYCLHCYNAIFLDGRRVEVDARGNRLGVNALFSPDAPVLAFPNRAAYGEYTFEGIYSAPDAPTMKLLRHARTIDEVAAGLPARPVGRPDIPFRRARE